MLSAQAIARVAKANGLLCVALLLAFFVLRTQRIFPNEYGVPDGWILCFYGLLLVIPAAIVLVGLAVLRLVRGPRDRALGRAFALSACPLLIPAAWGVVVLLR